MEFNNQVVDSRQSAGWQLSDFAIADKSMSSINQTYLNFQVPPWNTFPWEANICLSTEDITPSFTSMPIDPILCWQIPSTTLDHIYFKSILILLSHLWLAHWRGLFTSNHFYQVWACIVRTIIHHWFFSIRVYMWHPILNKFCSLNSWPPFLMYVKDCSYMFTLHYFYYNIFCSFSVTLVPLDLYSF
jgi:hypothetical protein